MLGGTRSLPAFVARTCLYRQTPALAKLCVVLLAVPSLDVAKHRIDKNLPPIPNPPVGGNAAELLVKVMQAYNSRKLKCNLAVDGNTVVVAAVDAPAAGVQGQSTGELNM